VKKLFALLAVCSLAVFVGCDDKKTTAKPETKTGGTFVQTNRADVTAHTDVTHTKVVGTETVHHTDTRVNTVVVPAKTTPGDRGPGLPGDKDKKPGDK
jgi:hypothetical protein